MTAARRKPLCALQAPGLADLGAIQSLVEWSNRGAADRYFEIKHNECRNTHHNWVVRVEVSDLSWSAESGPCDSIAQAATCALREAAMENHS